ncbi:MAG TPA: cytochrome c oxidase subunit II [Alphaproteobacteria bacterium]|nr:cytochrome c oxidase subunit II [Alphaproteobacteria bacterium]
MRIGGKIVGALGLAAVLAVLSAGATAAFAAAPEPWQLGLQPAATPVMEDINAFHNMLLVIIFAIAIFVTLLMGYVMWRFNEKANPRPSRTTHHTILEVTWTVVPILILMVISVPSFRLLYMMDKTDTPEMTLKVTGSQWYWSYTYPDHGNFTFDSLMIPDSDLKPGQLRLLEVDNRVVVPVDTNIRVLLTANAVIHSWAVPALGIKTDTVPGRINETWMRITKPGVYYGQCSELCGINHGFMPIAVEAVSKDDFQKWVAQARAKFQADAMPEPAPPQAELAAAPGRAPGETR